MSEVKACKKISKKIDALQGLIGRAKGIYMDDKHEDRSRILDVLDEAFDLCVEMRSAWNARQQGANQATGDSLIKLVPEMAGYIKEVLEFKGNTCLMDRQIISCIKSQLEDSSQQQPAGVVLEDEEKQFIIKMFEAHLSMGDVCHCNSCNFERQIIAKLSECK